MAKPSMIIDLISGPKEPGDDDEPFDDDDESDEPAAKQDPEALIAGIESQLAELRRAVL